MRMRALGFVEQTLRDPLHSISAAVLTMHSSHVFCMSHRVASLWGCGQVASQAAYEKLLACPVCRAHLAVLVLLLWVLCMRGTSFHAALGGCA
jgi:hypothetical protein